jgi:uncharacterized RDD family membrane protein YckC
MRNRIRAAFISAALVALAAAAVAAQTAPVAPAVRSVPSLAPVALQQPEFEQPPGRSYRYHGPMFHFGQDYTVRAGDVVRDVTSVLGDVTIEGRVEGDVLVILGSLRLASTAVVEGSVFVIGGNATIDAGATLRRDLVVAGGTATEAPGFLPEGDHVVIGTVGVGNALRGAVPWVMRGLLWGRLIVPELQWMWLVVGIICLIYLVLNALFDEPVRACAETLIEKPLSAFFLGLLVLLLTVPVIVLLTATVIGIAVVPVALCALVVAALVGKAGVARAIGRRIAGESSPDSRFQSFRSIFIGLAVLCLAYMVPVLGFVTWAMTGVLGLGAAAATFRVAIRREHPPRAPRPVAAVSIATPPPAGVTEVPMVAERAAVPPEAPPRAAVPEQPPGGDLALYPRATFLDRVAAFALDAVLVAIACQALDLMREDGWFLLALVAYHVAFWAWKGTTIGGIVVSLRVIRTEGTELRFVDALVRGLGSVFSIAALGIGCFWMLQDPERQMWHDKIAGTLVVKVPRHMVLP